MVAVCLWIFIHAQHAALNERSNHTHATIAIGELSASAHTTKTLKKKTKYNKPNGDTVDSDFCCCCSVASDCLNGEQGARHHCHILNGFNLLRARKCRNIFDPPRNKNMNGAISIRTLWLFSKRIVSIFFFLPFFVLTSRWTFVYVCVQVWLVLFLRPVSTCLDSLTWFY